MKLYDLNSCIQIYNQIAMTEKLNEAGEKKSQPITDELYKQKAYETSQLLLNNQQRTVEISLDTRRSTIYEILRFFKSTTDKDKEGKKAVISKIIDYLKSDPLTDQQAGAVARWIYFFPGLAYDDDIYDSKTEGRLNLEEYLELYVGDWKEITAILTNHPVREKAWIRAIQDINENNEPRVVYRMMNITEIEKRRIHEFGLIPNGLMNHDSLDALITRSVRNHFGIKGGSLKESDGYKAYLASLLFISKSNILRDVWSVGAEGGFFSHSPYMLGMSSTVGPGQIYGKDVVKIELPNNRLVPAYTKDYDAEHTILFHVEPQAIKKIAPLSEMLREEKSHL